MSTAVPPMSTAPISSAAAATAAAIAANAPTEPQHSEAPQTDASNNNNNTTTKQQQEQPAASNSDDDNRSSSPTSQKELGEQENNNSGDAKSGAANTAGTKRPVNRVGKNGEPLSEKKLRRLEKNRLSARECRRRKREATEDLQRQINLLEGENLRLRLQLQIGEEAEVSSQQEQQKLTESLDELLRSGASESEIYAKIEEYKEKFADYGRDRRSAIEFHLRNIERLLQPTQTTSVVLTTLQMGQNLDKSNTSGKPETAKPPASANASISPDSVHSTVGQAPAASADPGASMAAAVTSNLNMKSLFQHLVKILEVTPEQAAALKDSRFVAKEMDECLKASLDVLKDLRTRLTQCGQDLEQEFNNIRAILTPTQAAKFLVWVANNKACMHMLNELWNKVYPQMGSADSETSTP